jgi:hypothetical protein
MATNSTYFKVHEIQQFVSIFALSRPFMDRAAALGHHLFLCLDQSRVNRIET